MTMIEYAYKNWVRPEIFERTAHDAELAHEWGLKKLIELQKSPSKLWLARQMLTYRHPMLRTNFCGLDFATPLGLAAGFDKFCDIYHGAIPACGWSFCEVGGITLLGQSGNERVRMLRSLEHEALWNWMGFNNPGAELAAFLMSTNGLSSIPVGLNIGKGKDTALDDAPKEYADVFKTLWHFVQFAVINVSSPNTLNLRKLQAFDNIKAIIASVQAVNKTMLGHMPKPIGVKLAPDMTPDELIELIDLLIERNVDFVVLTNTSTQREICHGWDIPTHGGVSGQPLKTIALAMTKVAYRQIQLRKSNLKIIGVGGINDAESLYERILAGASLCQVYTAWPFRGPDLARQCNKGLVQLLMNHGFMHVAEAVGIAA